MRFLSTAVVFVGVLTCLAGVVSADTSSDLCNINQDTCPGRPVTISVQWMLNDGRSYAQSHYPGEEVRNESVSCYYGLGYTDCSWHAHLGFLEVDIQCIQEDGEEAECDISVE